MDKKCAIGVIFCVRKIENVRNVRNAKCEKREKRENPEKHVARGHVGLGAEVYSVKKLFFCTKKYCIFGGYMVY